MRDGRTLGWIVALMVCLATACRPTVPDRFLQPDEMEAILYDYYLTQSIAYEGDYRETSYRRNLYHHAVLEKYGVSEAEFDSSLVYYCSHADKFEKIYKNVSQRLKEQALLLGASTSELNKYAQLSDNGDTANMWKENTHVLLMPAPPYNRYEFAIEADSTFKKGDSFLLNFQSNFLYQSGTKDGIAYVAVEYSPDSIATYSTHIYMSSLTQLRIPAIPKLDIKRIRGFVYLDRGNDDSKTLKLLFIDDIQFVRFHQTKEDSIRLARADSLAMERRMKDSLKTALPSGMATQQKPDTPVRASRLQMQSKRKQMEFRRR